MCISKHLLEALQFKEDRYETVLIVCAALLLCGVAAARERGVHRVASCNIRVAPAAG